jgi:hypothetical protein
MLKHAYQDNTAAQQTTSCPGKQLASLANTGCIVAILQQACAAAFCKQSPVHVVSAHSQQALSGKHQHVVDSSTIRQQP